MKQIISFAFWLVLLPIILFEYFVLFWFWGGADTFNLFVTPLVFGIYLVSCKSVIKKRSP